MSGDFSPPPPPEQAHLPAQGPTTPAPPTMSQAYPGAAPTFAPPLYPTGGYPGQPVRPASGLAITSLVCGIAGIVLFWAVVPMLASIAAVITGHLALGQTKRDPQVGGRGMAFAGLILGYLVVGLLLFTIVSTIFGFIFFGAFTLPFLLAA